MGDYPEFWFDPNFITESVLIKIFDVQTLHFETVKGKRWKKLKLHDSEFGGPTSQGNKLVKTQLCTF